MKLFHLKIYKLSFLFIVLGCLLLPSAHAAEVKSAAKADSSGAAADIKNNATPLYVEFNGTDGIGSNLAFQLRERFNSSSQFELTDKEKQKFKIILTTSPEFPSRPSVGSAFSVVWLYYERENTYSSYLTQEMGTLSAEEVDALTARLVERTSGIALKYGYLLN